MQVFLWQWIVKRVFAVFAMFVSHIFLLFPGFEICLFVAKWRLWYLGQEVCFCLERTSLRRESAQKWWNNILSFPHIQTCEETKNRLSKKLNLWKRTFFCFKNLFAWRRKGGGGGGWKNIKNWHSRCARIRMLSWDEKKEIVGNCWQCWKLLLIITVDFQCRLPM